jgi:hypothetical protein
MFIYALSWLILVLSAFRNVQVGRDRLGNLA